MDSTTAKANTILGAEYLRELDAEARATRECLENVPSDKPDWKPHEKSMELGYLATLIADIPRWIRYMITDKVIDFANYEQFKAKSGEELVAHFDREMEAAQKALIEMTESDLGEDFVLKNGEQVYMTTPVGETISSTINHLVHHRGQLTVYLKLLDQKIPSIYGPSADTGGF